VLESPHVAVGAAIATKIPNPFISLPLVLASHIILDRIPHWNPHSYTEMQKDGHISKFTTKIALADVALSLVIGFFIASRSLPNYNRAIIVLIASFLSVLPDLAKAPYFLLHYKKGLIKKWVDFERSLQVEIDPFWGNLTQIIMIAASLFWVMS
jgi:ABC-type arginine transport system permease subunit